MKVDELNETVRVDRSVEELWADVCAVVLKRKGLPFHNAWMIPATLLRVTATEAVISTNNAMHKSQICTQGDLIRSTLSELLGRDVQLTVDINEDTNQKNNYVSSIATISVAPSQRPATNRSGNDYAAVDTSYQREMRISASNLNAKYTMERFVVGNNNRFCHSAAMAVAERPGESYNPLFVYGGVGLGKTHLMQAVGHLVMASKPKDVVLYVTCEKFTNDLINSIRSGNMIEFRKRYRQVDVLLIDDIQFIEGKESTQEEFFHTFNALRESGKQIILSSDRPPKDLAKLEERLRSRFEWGLIADIQPPDLETRIAILRKKCDSERMLVSDAVLEYIATSFTGNIRELEGALLRAHAYTNFNGQPLTLQTAADVLQRGTPVSPKVNITIENIISAVASHYRLDTSDLRSEKRSKDLAWPRHVAMYLAHDILQLSHSRIGEAFSNRKHPSVIYAIDKIKEELPKNVQLSQAIQQIRRQLGV